MKSKVEKTKTVASQMQFRRLLIVVLIVFFMVLYKVIATTIDLL